jgi:spore maturation protein CgeB
MRIVVAGSFYADSWAKHIAETLKSMGHSVLPVGDTQVYHHLNLGWIYTWTILERAFPSIERRHQRGVIRAIEAFQPNLVVITYGDYAPEMIHEMRQASEAKLVAWYPDALSNLGRQYLLASDLDSWFFKDRYMVETFRAKLGLNAHYLPPACWPVWHRRVQLTEADRRKYGCDLCTASNMYYYRARMLEIFDAYDLKMWGIGYPPYLVSPLRAHYPGIYVAEGEKAKAFNAAKIVLNTMHYAEIEGVNQRLIEATGCGGFVITEWNPALPELFEPEHEVVTFRTRRELKEKVDYYLAHPEERQEIADRGYARAQRDHIYEKRFDRMLEIVFPDSGACFSPEESGASGCGTDIEVSRGVGSPAKR